MRHVDAQGRTFRIQTPDPMPYRAAEPTSVSVQRSPIAPPVANSADIIVSGRTSRVLPTASDNAVGVRLAVRRPVKRMIVIRYSEEVALRVF